jgi:hypothetical protein
LILMGIGCAAKQADNKQQTKKQLFFHYVTP